MKKCLLAVFVLTIAVGGYSAPPEVVEPYEIDAKPSPKGAIDALVLASLQKHDITPANLCSDAVFIRRVYLDVIGALPEAQDVLDFLADESEDKRSVLIDQLLEREEFADYWSLKWCDLLRVKAEFPINLWPNGVQTYHRWIRNAIRDNMPYDEFVRHLLTSSGSNFRVPPVNFYNAIQGRDPATIADAVALTFMGVRTRHWTEAERAGMAAFFSRVAYKGTAEWKEVIVHLDPAPSKPFRAVFPGGEAIRITPDQDPRRVFADWLIDPKNPWFTRNAVNRTWAWLMGTGIIHEPDDVRPDNPPSNPELLAYLERELIAADYDLRRIYRIILNSDIYQQSAIPRSNHPKAERLFAHYKVRRLDAEVLMDALCRLSGWGEEYSSPIPEPFTFIPPSHPTITLADGSISSQFLEMFGRPARDTGLASERNNKITTEQRLYLLNSSAVQQRIYRNQRLIGLFRWAKGKLHPIIRGVYLSILSREPTAAEIAAVEEYHKRSGLSVRNAALDLAWALINSKEFLYRH